MKYIITVALFLIIVSLTAYNPSFMSKPAISPDGNTVCFSYMSDLWLVPFEGGEAKRITVSESNDTNPIFSPDGKWIAFLSDRNGKSGIYLIPSEGGFAETVYQGSRVSISDWFQDNERIMGVRYQHDTDWGQYEFFLDGRRPREITPISDHFNKLSPCEKRIIFNLKGDPFRPAYRGSIAGNLWEYDIETNTYSQLTFTDTTTRYPVYSYVNPYIYYAESDGEKFQLFRVENYDFENPQQLTFFDDWSVRCLTIARHNDRILYEKFDKIWKYCPDTGVNEELEIIIKQDFLPGFSKKENYSNAFSNAALSPDGKLIAFSYKYDLFAMPEQGGEVKRLTFDQKGIDQILISGDNRTIYFTKRVKGNLELFRLDINQPETIYHIPWSQGKAIRRIFLIAPDKIAVHFSDNGGYYRVALLDTGTDNVSEFLQNESVWSWFLAYSPDLDYAFYVKGDPQTESRHLSLYDFENDRSTGLISSSDYLGRLYLGKDNKSLFISLGEELVRIDLIPKPDVAGVKNNWDNILAELPETRKARIKLEEALEERTFRVQSEGIGSRVHTIAAKPGLNFAVHIDSDSTLYYVNWDYMEDRFTLYRMNYEGKNDNEIISLSGEVSDFQTAFVYHEENDRFYVVMDNQLLKINPHSGQREVVKNEFIYEYDVLDLNRSVFDELWSEFGDGFYDPGMHDREWDEMFDRYRPFIDKSYNMNFFSSVVNEMIGELNASHTGFYPRSEGRRNRTDFAYLPCSYDYRNILEEGIRFRRVYRGSSLYQKYGIREGDILLSIDSKNIDPYVTVEELLEDKSGKDIHLRIKTPAGMKDAFVKGLSFMEVNNLFYEDTVEHNRQLVNELSGNKIGYLHIPRMSYTLMQPFLDDLFARNYDKDAVIIDVRGNGGGNLSYWLIDTLTRSALAYTTSRHTNNEFIRSPSLIWDKPLALLIDEHSFSDAEIFPILFRQKGLGKVIGMPTSGGVIGTGHYRLMDGSSMRMPGHGWYTKEMVNMEGTGATPDIEIEMTPENIINRDDVQIKKGVEVLLEEIGG